MSSETKSEEYGESPHAEIPVKPVKPTLDKMPTEYPMEDPDAEMPSLTWKPSFLSKSNYNGWRVQLNLVLQENKVIQNDYKSTILPGSVSKPLLESHPRGQRIQLSGLLVGRLS